MYPPTPKQVAYLNFLGHQPESYDQAEEWIALAEGDPEYAPLIERWRTEKHVLHPKLFADDAAAMHAIKTEKSSAIPQRAPVQIIREKASPAPTIVRKERQENRGGLARQNYNDVLLRYLLVLSWIFALGLVVGLTGLILSLVSKFTAVVAFLPCAALSVASLAFAVIFWWMRAVLISLTDR